MIFFYLFFLRGFFAFLFVPLLFIFFQDFKIIGFLEWDLFLKRSFLPFDRHTILLCSIFFLSTVTFLYFFYNVSRKLNFSYFYNNLNQKHILNEISYIFFFLFLLTRIKLFFIPNFFDLNNWTNLLFQNQFSLIISQMFFPSFIGIAMCSLLLLKPKLKFYEKIFLIIFALGASFAVINLQSRIYIIVLSFIFVFYIFNHVNKKLYRNLFIGFFITVSFSYVFLNSEFRTAENFFVIYDNHLRTIAVDQTNGINGYERLILDLIGRLDLTHIINSWWNQGVIFDVNKQKWGRDIMVVHHADLKTTIGVPVFISFLPNKFMYQDFIILVFLGFLVALIFKINYLSSRNLGHIFFVAIMCKFCLSWPEKRLDGMLIQTMKPFLISIFPFVYFYFRTFLINRLKLNIFANRQK